MADRDNEMLDDVFEAVFAGDLAKAEETLALMQGAGMRGEQIRRAKYRARPELAPRGAPPLREPFVLPVPGARPGDTLGGRGTLPRLEKKKKAKSTEGERLRRKYA